MSKEPTQADLINIGISQSYASMILAGRRKPSARVAIHIYRKTGWKHPHIADLTEPQIDALEALDPWKLAA